MVGRYWDGFEDESLIGLYGTGNYIEINRIM